MEDFKKGDVVKIIGKKKANLRSGEIGDVGTIVSEKYTLNGKYQTWKEVKCNLGSQWWYSPDEITHDTDIHVGDRVRVTGSNIGKQDNGNLGRVVAINHNIKHPYKIRIDNDECAIWCTVIKVSPDTVSNNKNNKTEGGREMEQREYMVGERVKIKKGSRFEGQSEFVGEIICGRNAGGWYMVEFPECKNIYKSEDLVPVPPESVTRDGYTYTKLKNLSPESILKGHPCHSGFEEYVQAAPSFYADQELEDVLGNCTKYPSWLPWLVDKGYIGREMVVSKYKIKCGDIYIIDGEKYLLYQVAPSRCCLVGMAEGNRLAEMVHISTLSYNILPDEFKLMLGSRGGDLDKIYATRIPYQRG